MLDKTTALKAATLFKDLDENTLRLIGGRAVERRYEKDDLLFVAGEEARGIHVIVEGAVRAFRGSAQGREQVIHVERAGATIGDVPVFDDEPYPSTAASEGETITLFIDKRHVQQLCLEYPEIPLARLRVLAGRLRRCAELVETLSLRKVGQRLGAFCWRKRDEAAFKLAREPALTLPKPINKLRGTSVQCAK